MKLNRKVDKVVVPLGEELNEAKEQYLRVSMNANIHIYEPNLLITDE